MAPAEGTLERVVQHGGAHVEEGLHRGPAPAHPLGHAPGDDLVRRGERLPECLGRDGLARAREGKAVLNKIYEEDFLGFSYGFRPKRGQHDARDALVGIGTRKLGYILNADIRSFFDEVSREWLAKVLNHRTGDPRIIHLIQKWLKAGYLEDGAVPTNSAALGAFRYHITVFWLRALRRRSQKDRMTWSRTGRLAADWLPKPCILHPWPSSGSPSNTRGRSRVRRIPLARTCTGGAQ